MLAHVRLSIEGGRFGGKAAFHGVATLPDGLAGARSSMSSESDGHERPDNIDTIKQLLRKLEEVAARDDGTALTQGDTKPVEQPPGLATLQRGMTSARSVAEAASRGAHSPIELPAITKAGDAGQRGGGRNLVVAGASFALGIAAAAGLIVAFDPFKQRLGLGTTVAQRPAGTTALTKSVAEQPPQIATPEAATGPAEPVRAEPAITEPSRTVAGNSSALEPQAFRETSQVAEVPKFHAPTEPPREETARQPAASGAAETGPVHAAANAVPLQHVLRLPDRLEIRAGERRQLDLIVEPRPAENDRLLVVLRQVPGWMSLSKGGAIGNEIWLLPAHQAGDVWIDAGEAATGTTEIKVEVARIDGRIIAQQMLAVRALPLQQGPPSTIIAAPANSEQMILRLQARGEFLLDTGEVEAARTLLRTAAEAGSVVAALRLAETYDPSEVQRLGVTEGSADPAQAVRWYEHAHALGSPVAAARLVMLGRR